MRDYLQMLDAEFEQRMKRSQLPGSLWGSDPALANARWDRQAVDQAIDRASGVPDDSRDQEDLDIALGIARQYQRGRRSPIA